MDQRVAVVTGGNRGIGLELCRQLGQRGYRVYLMARSAESGEAAAQALRDDGVDVTFVVLDVTDGATVQASASRIDGEVDQVDLLINSAGILLDPQMPALQVPLDDVSRSFDTNVMGPLRMCQAFSGVLGQGAQIINMSSGMGQLSEMGSGALAYRLSKTALNTLTRVLSNELQSKGVNVTSICPGWVKTEMGGLGATRSVEDSVEGILKTVDNAQALNGLFVRDGEPIPW